jgi:glycosyltransferase involved in cell wall biosynthesis
VALKVLILTQYFWPETFRITEVAESLQANGCDVVVLTGQPNYPEGVILEGYSAASVCKEMYEGLRIKRVPLAPRGSGSKTRLIINYLSFVVSASIFGPWLLRGQRFDAILVYAPSPIMQAIPAIWLSWLKEAKLITWVQDLWPESLSATGFVRSPAILDAVSIVVKWIYRHNDLLLVQSRAFIESVVNMAGSTPVIYHPNPGEIAFSNMQREEQSVLQLDTGFNVVFAGNLGTAQALGTILAAARLLKDIEEVRFVIVGSGSQSDWLRQNIELLGLKNMSMVGRFPPSEMPGIFAQASALLVTLVRDSKVSQTVPSKIQAYLAAARPIIAAIDGEGARIVIEAGAGIACQAEDAEALAEAVRHLYRTRLEERESMAQRGRVYYEQHFEPTLLARQLKEILSDTVDGKLQ